MGIKQIEIDATEVIIKTPDKEIIISEPQVSKVNMMYQQLTHDTTDMTNLRVKCADFTVSVNKNVKDVYAYQGEITTPSRCGRMDQGCAYGNKPILMIFDLMFFLSNLQGLPIKMALTHPLSRLLLRMAEQMIMPLQKRPR